jgi:hypothetical protein
MNDSLTDTVRVHRRPVQRGSNGAVSEEQDSIEKPFKVAEPKRR